MSVSAFTSVLRYSAWAAVKVIDKIGGLPETKLLQHPPGSTVVCAVYFGGLELILSIRSFTGEGCVSGAASSLRSWVQARSRNGPLSQTAQSLGKSEIVA